MREAGPSTKFPCLVIIGGAIKCSLSILFSGDKERLFQGKWRIIDFGLTITKRNTDLLSSIVRRAIQKSYQIFKDGESKICRYSGYSRAYFNLKY